MATPTEMATQTATLTPTGTATASPTPTGTVTDTTTPTATPTETAGNGPVVRLAAESGRTASIADLALPNAEALHRAVSGLGTMVLTVNDDTNDGWSVTIESSDFAYSGFNGGTAIAAASFSITAAGAPAVVSGQPIDGGGGGPGVPSSGGLGTLDEPKTVLVAGAGFGVGTYTQGLEVSLLIPAQSRAGTYTGTLTTTMMAAP